MPKAVASDLPAKGMKKAKKTERPTKAMSELVDQVLSNGDTLTADGVNGVLEHSSEEDVDITTANEEPSTSMQAEAQRTVDKEMADELATDDERNDQGAALLTGFDSDGDDLAEDEGLDPAKMADLDLTKQQRKKLRQATRKESKEGTGTVYVGRIPRGFYEAQMRQYFSQFGNITNIRLSRNKTTGASKHFAFIEFESNEVAKIVAQTMDNYLMFGHILKCKYAPSESLHPDTWKGANKRFKVVPYNKIEKRMLEEPKTKDQWEGKIAREQGRREKRLSEAQSMGYDYELPQIKSVDSSLEQKKLTQEEQTGAIEPPNGVPKNAVALKARQRKRNKGKGGPTTEEADAENSPANDTTAEAATSQKASKAKNAETASKVVPISTPVNTSNAAQIKISEDFAKLTSKKAKKDFVKKHGLASGGTLPDTSVEGEAIGPGSAAKVTSKPDVNHEETARLERERLDLDFPKTKFAFHPDELNIEERRRVGEAAAEAKNKAKNAKKKKAAEAAAAQMRLNVELSGTVEPVKDQVESDVDIAATAAVLLATGGGREKATAGKKAGEMDTAEPRFIAANHYETQDWSQPREEEPIEEPKKQPKKAKKTKAKKAKA